MSMTFESTQVVGTLLRVLAFMSQVKKQKENL
jgi:hypothetical protein